MQRIDDIIHALRAQFVRFLLDESRKFAARLEIHVRAHARRNGRITIADCAYNADFRVAELDHDGRVAILHSLVRCPVVNVYGKEGKVCKLSVGLDFLRRPVKLVIAKRHRRTIDIVQPLGCKFALGVVGLAATLPHIPRRKHYRIRG